MNVDRFRRRRSSAPTQAQIFVRPEAPSPVYVDGAYVISEAGEATTWAVCDHGRWGVIYACAGAEILSAWVESDDLPLHVLAAALREVER